MPRDASGGVVCIIQLLSALISQCSLHCFFTWFLWPSPARSIFGLLDYCMLELISQRTDRFSYVTFWCLHLRLWCWCLEDVRARARALPRNLVNLMTFSAWQQWGNVQQSPKKWSVCSMQLKHTNSNVLTKVVWNYLILWVNCRNTKSKI